MNEKLQTYLYTGALLGATAIGIAACKRDLQKKHYVPEIQTNTPDATSLPQMLGNKFSAVRNYFEALKDAPVKETLDFGPTKNNATLKVINFTDYHIDPEPAGGVHDFFDAIANTKAISVLDYNLESPDKEKIAVQLVFYPQPIKQRVLLLIPSRIEIDSDTLAFTGDAITGAFESEENTELIAYERTLDDFLTKSSQDSNLPPLISSHLYIMSVCQSALAIRAFGHDPRLARRYVCAAFSTAYFAKQIDQDYDSYRESIVGMVDEQFITGKKTPLFDIPKDLYEAIPQVGLPLLSPGDLPDKPEGEIMAF